MHEMSIAMEVCGIAERQVGAEKLATVLAVGLDVGDAAGVEIENLEFCLGVLLSEAPFGRAKPRINRVDGNVLRVTYLEVEDASPDD
jgi:Zn finger protein HypA/HybF involved in hydrogenase expression